MSRVFARQLTAAIAFLVPILLFQNCGMVRPPSVMDMSSTSAKFEAAKVVLQKNCTSCHGIGSNTNLAFNTESDFLSSGLVSAGDIHLSKLIFRVRNYVGSTTSARNMPPSGPLSESDYKVLVDWVTSIRPSALACTPNEHLLKPQIKRLTRTQYINSVRAAFGQQFNTNGFPTLNDGNPRLGLAADPDRLNVNEINMNQLYDSALAISTTSRTSVTDILNCVNAANDTCFATMISTYGQRLWRRPVTAAETTDLQAGITRVNNASGTRAQKMEYLLMSLILSPNHLFRTELGAGTSLPTGIFQLTHYEVASLLSFAMWDSPPDTILMGLAASNSLYSIDTLKAQATRLAADSRFQNKMSGFIVDLLKIDDVKTIDKDPTFNLTTTERDNLHLSAQQTLNASYSSPSVSLFAPFHLQSFQANQSTARFMNLDPGTLTGTMTPVSMNSQQRYGMFTHPAFLTAMGGRTASGIIKRGVFTLEQLLCYHLKPAPADISEIPTLPPGFDRNLVTTREELTVTHSSQSRCIGCHSMIDPAGFGLENFNALGQFRLVEKAANVPIDSSGRISGVTKDEISFNNSVGFAASVANNADFQACVQKHFFKFTSGQDAHSGPGRCEYQNYEAKVKAKGPSTGAAFESFVELDSFLRRRAQ